MRCKGRKGSSPQEGFPALPYLELHSPYLHPNSSKPHCLGGFPLSSLNAGPSTLYPTQAQCLYFSNSPNCKISISLPKELGIVPLHDLTTNSRSFPDQGRAGNICNRIPRLLWLKCLTLARFQNSGTQGQELGPPQGRTWVRMEKALELAGSDGTLGNLIKLLEPQSSYM